MNANEERPTAAEGSLSPTSEFVRRLESFERLRTRRYELLPLVGEGAVFTEVQGRMPGAPAAQAGLTELAGSIAVVGVLQPILVERISEDGTTRHLLVSGERRLRACRLGLADQPENPNFRTVPALICDGPLTEEERRAWQLIENVEREDLQPGELGYALLFERCAVLAAHLSEEGVATDQAETDDPVERWERLVEAAGGTAKAGRLASWDAVLARLGLRQMKSETAKKIVSALRTLPPELTDEFDRERVPLATRLEFMALHRGRSDAANELWEAVKNRGVPGRLRAAVQEMTEHPSMAPAAALERAEGRVDAANRARAETLRRRGEQRAAREDIELGDSGRLVSGPAPRNESFGGGILVRDDADDDLDERPAARVRREASEDAPASAPPRRRETSPAAEPTPETAPDSGTGPRPVEPKTVRGVLESMRRVLAALRAGETLDPHDDAALRLYMEELLAVMGPGPESAAAES